MKARRQQEKQGDGRRSKEIRGRRWRVQKGQNVGWRKWEQVSGPILSLHQLRLQLTNIRPDTSKPLFRPSTDPCHLVHQHHPNGTGIPHRLLHPPIRSLTLMLMMNASCRQGFLVWRYLQPRQLTTTNTSGRQNKICIPQVIERQCWTMGIALLKE